MPSEDIAISVRNLTKSYRLFGHPGDRIKQFVSLGLKQYHRDFNALKDVSFDIRKGETIGIIGRNGSGKSTLLQLICGILKPTEGTVTVNGRISALLELGAGFNPEFTGRENVYFQGALMGFTKAQMDGKFGDIAAFADIREFIDQPVRTYSSGMFVRLAFATMIHADADILVIDEALAVGDEAFQRKCFERLAEYLGGSQKILLFVSHNLRQVERVCSRTLWIEDNHLVADGVSSDICTDYQQSIHRKVLAIGASHSPTPNIADSGEIHVGSIRLMCGSGTEPVSEIDMHSPARVVVDFSCHSHLTAPEVIIGFHTTDQVFIAAASTAGLKEPIHLSPGEHRIACHFPDIPLLPGAYQIRLAFIDQYRRNMWIGHRLCPFRVVTKPGGNLMHIPLGLVDIPSSWSMASAEMESE